MNKYKSQKTPVSWFDTCTFAARLKRRLLLTDYFENLTFMSTNDFHLEIKIEILIYINMYIFSENE